jgi:hypothetical protein
MYVWAAICPVLTLRARGGSQIFFGTLEDRSGSSCSPDRRRAHEPSAESFRRVCPTPRHGQRLGSDDPGLPTLLVWATRIGETGACQARPLHICTNDCRCRLRRPESFELVQGRPGEGPAAVRADLLRPEHAHAPEDRIRPAKRGKEEPGPQSLSSRGQVEARDRIRHYGGPAGVSSKLGRHPPRGLWGCSSRRG